MFKGLKKLIPSQKNLKLFLSLALLGLVLYIGYNAIIITENYSTSDNILNDAANKFRNMNLYQEDKGVIGTRKEFGNMRKPYLNPILVPVVKGKTE